MWINANTPLSSTGNLLNDSVAVKYEKEEKEKGEKKKEELEEDQEEEGRQITDEQQKCES